VLAVGEVESAGGRVAGPNIPLPVNGCSAPGTPAGLRPDRDVLGLVGHAGFGAVLATW